LQLILFYIVLFPYLTVCQTVTGGSIFDTDIFGNIYVASGSQLIKYDRNCNNIAEYTNHSLGAITRVDAGNPFKLLVFFGKQNRLVFLDNKLSTIVTEINLDKTGISQVQTLCGSQEGGFWLYDPVDRNLKLFSYDLDLIRQTVSSEISTKEQAYFISEKNGQLFAAYQSAVLIYDRFGNYTQEIPLKRCESFQVVNNTILCLSEHKIHEYNLQTNATTTDTIPDTNKYIDVKKQNDFLYLLGKTVVVVLKNE